MLSLKSSVEAMESTVIAQGLSLMFYGVSVVFIFLTLLIFTIAAVSYVIQRWFPDQDRPVLTKKLNKPSATSPPSAAVSRLTLKIIQAAVQQHRASS